MLSHKFQLFLLNTLPEDFKRFFLVSSSKNSIFPPPIMGSLPLRIIIWTNLNLNYIRMLSHKLYSFCGQFGSERIFKDFSVLSSNLKIWPPLWPHPTPETHESQSFPDQLVFKNKNFQEFLYRPIILYN